MTKKISKVTVLAFAIAILAVHPVNAQRVTITELGTLEGDYISAASDMNNSGQIVGWSGWEPHAFLWTITDRMLGLGALDGYGSKAIAINDAGEVAGTNYFYNGGYRPFFWSVDKGMIDIGTLGGDRAEAVNNNESGQIIGWSEPPSTAYGYSIRPFIWSEETGMIDLGSLGGPFGKSVAINQAGNVVGWSGSSPTSPGEHHAFFWSPEKGMIDLGTLGGPISEPTAINDQNHVLGWSRVSNSNSLTHAFLWTAETGMIDLGTLGGMYSYPVGINKGGQVLCSSYNSSGDPRPFIVAPLDTNNDGKPDTWHRDCDKNGVNDLMVDLGTLGGWATYAVAINDSGQVVGRSGSSAFVITPTDTDGDGVLNWYGDVNADGINDLMKDLGTLGISSEAVAINNRGQIVGKSDVDYHTTHAFMWTSENGMIDLGSLTGSFSYPVKINEIGQVMGYSQNDQYRFVPVIWTLQSETVVSIDIKPDSDTNYVNIASAGVLNVAILSSDQFDATQINPETITLNGASVKLAGRSGKYLCHKEDVNNDALIDIVCQVYTNEMTLVPGESAAVLMGETYDLTPIRGEDVLRIVP